MTTLRCKLCGVGLEAVRQGILCSMAPNGGHEFDGLACCECQEGFCSNEELHTHLVNTGHGSPDPDTHAEMGEIAAAQMEDGVEEAHANA